MQTTAHPTEDFDVPVGTLCGVRTDCHRPALVVARFYCSWNGKDEALPMCVECRDEMFGYEDGSYDGWWELRGLPTPGSRISDPNCPLAPIDPEHVCARRDGALLTGDNGDCHAGAVEAMRGLEEDIRLQALASDKAAKA